MSPRSIRAIGPLHIHHVEQRVIEWPKVRIDLGIHIARQIPELLAGFDGGPREDDAAHIFLHQRTDRHSHGQVGLARARRADTDHDVVFFDRVQIVFLSWSLRNDEPLPCHDGGSAEEQFFEGSVLIVTEGGQRVCDVV
jgi:hypothetical protein